MRLKYLVAPFWKRALAYLVDFSIVSFIIIFPLQNKLGSFTSSYQDKNFFEFYELFLAKGFSDSFSQIFLIVLAIILLSVLYWALLEYKLGQSIGKIILKLHVHPTGKKISFKDCFIRNISKFSTFILLIDCLNMLINKSHQRFLERLSNTEVIEEVAG